MSSLSRKNFLTGAALFLLQFGIPLASAANGPALKPTKLGQIIVWRGKKYTAIKSGKKLIWNKGVAIPVPSKSPSANPSSTPTAAPTPSPSASMGGSFQIDLAASVDVPNGQTRIIYSVDSRAYAKAFIITRENNSLIAFDNNCTHESCAVELSEKSLLCNCHISYFNRITGNPESGPASEPLKSYKVTEVNGRILVTDSSI